MTSDVSQLGDSIASNLLLHREIPELNVGWRLIAWGPVGERDIAIHRDGSRYRCRTWIRNRGQTRPVGAGIDRSGRQQVGSGLTVSCTAVPCASWEHNPVAATNYKPALWIPSKTHTRSKFLEGPVETSGRRIYAKLLPRGCERIEERIAVVKFMK